MQLLKTNRARKAIPVTLPAPVGGLNGRDGLANMPPTDAFLLDNWVPSNTSLDSRGGSLNFFTGCGAAVESLEVYAGGSASKLLAFAGANVYDATLTGVAGATVATGRNSAKITSCMFSNAGAQYLIGASGADVLFSYDGTTFANLTITGLTGLANTLHGVHAFKGRLYLAQKDQLGFYYLAVGAIQGAATYFDLSQVCRRGGYLLGIASFSQDAGNGPSDYIVFMTSEGEYIVYTGIDPANAATWALAGRYYSPPPIGRKGWFNFRSDLYIICDEGILSFSEIRSSGDAGKDIEYISSKLGTAFTDYTTNYATHGWCAVPYPRVNLLVVNVATGSSEANDYVQFAMNTDTGNWCRFTGWNALTFAIIGRRLYFGTVGGNVVLADEGDRDNGEEIVCDARQAYNSFDDSKGMGSADKHFHFAIFVVQADGKPAIASALNVNFKDELPTLSPIPLDTDGAQWDVSDWDITSWAGVGATQNLSIPYGKLGYTASIWFRASTFNSSLKWYATRLVMEKTTGLVLT